MWAAAWACKPHCWPTQSGLAMIPMVAGILSTSVGSGLGITRTGRYKIFPIIGAASLLVGLGLSLMALAYFFQRFVFRRGLPATSEPKEVAKTMEGDA